MNNNEELIRSSDGMVIEDGELIKYCGYAHIAVVPEGVKKICIGAFLGCYYLKGIELPESLEEIEEGAIDIDGLELRSEYGGAYYLGNRKNPYMVLFKAVKNIVSCTVHSSTRLIASEAFSECSELWRVDIPEGVVSIGEEAFWECSSLRSVSLPRSLKRIDDFAFTLCYNLAEVINRSQLKIEAGSDEFGDVARYASAVHSGESGIVASGDFLFSDASGEKYLIDYLGESGEAALPECEEGYRIGRFAFYERVDLKKVTIPQCVKEIGESAFSKCASLKSVEILTGLTKIDKSAFSECHSLKRVKIPDTVSDIRGEAFFNCKALAEIILPDSLANLAHLALPYSLPIESMTKYGNGYYLGSEKNPYLVFMKPENHRIQDCELHRDTRFIYCNAFSYCPQLKSIELPEGIVSIGAKAFSDSGLKQITLPESLKSIDLFAFFGCEGLVICGRAGSYAEKYAARFSIDFRRIL